MVVYVVDAEVAAADFDAADAVAASGNAASVASFDWKQTRRRRHTMPTISGSDWGSDDERTL